MPIKRKPIKKLIKRKNPSDKVLAIGIYHERGVTFSAILPASLNDKQLVRALKKEQNMTRVDLDEVLRVDSDLNVHSINWS